MDFTFHPIGRSQTAAATLSGVGYRLNAIDVAAGKVVGRSGTVQAPDSVVMTGDGKRILAGATNPVGLLPSSVHVFDHAGLAKPNAESMVGFNVEGAIAEIALSPDEGHISVLTSGSLDVLGISPKSQRSLGGVRKFGVAVGYIGDEHLLVCTHDHDRDELSVDIRGVRNGHPVYSKIIETHGLVGWLLADISSDGRRLAYLDGQAVKVLDFGEVADVITGVDTTSKVP